MRLNISELARNTSAETIPIQCRIPSERPTTDPASCLLGSTVKAVCASTGKNINPPSHTISDSNIRNRRNDMSDDIMNAGRIERQGARLRTENQQLTTDFKLTDLNWHPDSLDQFLNQLLSLFGFFQTGRIASVHRHTMGKHCNCQRLEIFGNAEIAAIEKRHRLPGAVEHLGSAGRYSEREVFRLTGRADNREHVTNQRFLDSHLGNGLLHFQYVAAA